MLKNFIEIHLIGEDNGFYDFRYTSFDSVGNDFPKNVVINTSSISSAKEVYGFSQHYRREIERLDTEDALDNHYQRLFTEVTMNNGDVIRIQEALDELVGD